MNGMHGTGTVLGLQFVAAARSKSCCARVFETQPSHQNHLQGQNHHSHHLARDGGSNGGSSNGGSYGRTSMTTKSSVEVMASHCFLPAASRNAARSSAPSALPR